MQKLLVGATPCSWNLGSTSPRGSKMADFEPIIARYSASAVTPREKTSINANRKSSTRFPMSLRWSSYVAPKSPKGGLKNAKRPISIKNALRLKKVCYKVSLCENCQRQSCKAFIGHSLTVQKLLVGGDPLYLKFGVNQPPWSKIADFEPIIARSASAVTPSEKSSINANRKSTTRWRWSSYVAPKSPKKGLENANLFESWPASK